MASVFITETRQYATRQRPNPVTVHGPYASMEEATEAAAVLRRKSARNDNRSSFQIQTREGIHD